VKIVTILEHCGIDECEGSRPRGYGKIAKFFSAAHKENGGRVYVGPCECACEKCTNVKEQKIRTLDKGHL
jgi:hypothetical protein